MNQAKILELLNEAARPDCEYRRWIEIHCMFGDATGAKVDGVYILDTPVAGASELLNEVLTSTWQHRRDLLPMLFPTVAALCGHHAENSIFADIDWSLVP